MRKVECKVRVQGDLSETFKTNSGLREMGYQFSTGKSIERINLKKTYTRSLQVMAYADYIVINARKIYETIITFERKVLRIIYGGVNEHGMWRRPYNFELYRHF